jgi:hypothetical protein
MQLSQNDEHNFSITKFEKMLKTNNVIFFDSIEFENIIQHYLEISKIALAKKSYKNRPRTTPIIHYIRFI